MHESLNDVVGSTLQCSTTINHFTAFTMGATGSGASTSSTADQSKAAPKKTTYELLHQSDEWNSKLGKLTNKLNNSPETLVCGLGRIKVCTENEFQIGEGTSGTCAYLGLHSTDDKSEVVREVVVKNVRANRNMERNNEATILSHLISHKNIVDYMDGKDVGEDTYTVFQLCDFTLEAWVRDNKTTPDRENRTRDMVRQLLEALKFLYENGIVHCDLNPENILVMKDRKLKLGDFGLSRKLKDGHTSSKGAPAGTPRWRAKEVLDCKPGVDVNYATSTDIQVAGMVVFYVRSGGIHPFDDTTSHTASDAVVQKNIISGKSDLSAVKDRLAVDMVKTMLAANPADRPSADTLLRHAYLRTNNERFQFLAAVGDEEEIATYGSNKWKYNATAMAIENTKTTVLPPGMTDWQGSLTVMPMLGQLFQNDFKKTFRKPTPHKYTESMCHLLRTLRNIQSHFYEQSATAQATLGNTRYPYAYFDKELPELFPEVYFIIRDTARQPDWTKRPKLKDYF
ncbi:putative serine/threonine-protein kinase irlD [Lamellibrachia satsuma]|nr:putative serine/threonine-protein kinase irlD [Lamellibrachia satsuma]